jgi:monoterpene epsilon-lactone hydrolase
MVSLIGHFMNLIFRCGKDRDPSVPRNYAAERAHNAKQPGGNLRGLSVSKIQIGKNSALLMKKKGNGDHWVFYIHGGGFTVGDARERRDICAYIANHWHMNCLLVNYRLAPENKWPAMLEDVFEAWQHLPRLGIDPEKVVMAGESAGGTLALSLPLLLKEKGLDQPAGIVSYSPVTDQSAHFPSHSLNVKSDYMLRDSVIRGLGDPVYRKEENLKDPLISPLHGNYEGLPPVYLAASDTEVLLDDTVVLYHKLKEEGHPAGLDIRHGVCHAWPVFPVMPEAKTTLNRTYAFLYENVLEKQK